MKHLSWIVTLPLMLALVIFSLANRGEVSVDLWPFEESFALPLSWLMLGSLFVGVFAGGVAAWLSGAKTRRRARELKYDKAHLEREVIRLKREVERAKGADEARTAAPALPPAANNGTGRARPLSTAAPGR
jgi:uncharacterized integral membrane protein